ncbi:hypothetical protein KP509_17G022300 [Ceratopteris richardii]|uniref:Uncharacterized protein n=1 Tax=Ceratopteris richardii TaxID=49495 RepID=A0A8T2SSQ2_CERRI|nr:hypothetical protein KP509_17G022300 [Ceratopteris richardii]
MGNIWVHCCRRDMDLLCHVYEESLFAAHKGARLFRIVELPVHRNSSNHAEQAIVREDAKSILVQLSTVEEQLLALEGSGSSFQTSLLHNFSNPNDCAIEKLGSNDEEVNSSQIYKNDIWITETEESSMFVEEKVVNGDVANFNNSPCYVSQLTTSEEVIQIDVGKHQRSGLVQWEGSEEEKHLDLLSFGKKNILSSLAFCTLEGPCKPDVQQFKDIGKELDWDAKKVVPLDDITRRLQALESENMFQQHHLFPSSPECVNIIKLKEIVQELQKLLKTNKDASTTANKNIINISSMSACFQGGEVHMPMDFVVFFLS